MAAEHNQDLPAEILEKLRDLELELEDGDITLKGFEKKKASLLADVSNPTSPTSTSNQKSEAEILEELGPEPSAADVVDFLDFLPSPTHSPTRTVEAVNHMEENHRQIQQQQQQQQQQQYQQPPPQQYQPQYQPQYQSQPQMRPMQPQYRPYPGGNGTGRGNNTVPYYGNSNMASPLPNNRPYMVARNGYPQSPLPPPQQQQQQQMRPPGSNPYYGQRPPSSIPPQNVIYRPQQQPYNTNQSATSPRPMYRPQPRPSMNSGGYRVQQPQYVQSSASMSGAGRMMEQPQQPQQPYGNYAYNAGGMGSVNRSLSTNTGTSMGKQRHDYNQQRQYHSMYSTRSDSMEWNQ